MLIHMMFPKEACYHAMGREDELHSSDENSQNWRPCMAQKLLSQQNPANVDGHQGASETSKEPADGWFV